MVATFSSIVSQYSTGTPGIRIIESVSNTNFTQPQIGSAYFVGQLPRGPVKTPIPVLTSSNFIDIYGDPNDPQWIYDLEANHLLPDMIDGFLQNSNGAGILWVSRLDLDDAKTAKKQFFNSAGVPVLEIEAANPGDWGGSYRKITSKPIVFSTSRTFTIISEGVAANEYAKGEVVYGNTRLKLTSNTASDPTTNAVIFTVSPQYNLAEIIPQSSVLTGTVEYAPYVDKGSITYTVKTSLTGSAFSSSGLSLTGTGSSFTTELTVGDILYINGDIDVVMVTGIASDTLITIDEALTSPNITTLETDNRVVTGTATTFTTDFAVGDDLYVLIDGEYTRREIESITDDTELVLVSGFTQNLTDVSGFKLNKVVTVTSGALETELKVNDSIVNPLDGITPLQIAAVDTVAGTFTLVDVLENAIPTGTKIRKIGANVDIEFIKPGLTGLSIVFSNGVRFPDTHFSMNVFFNGSLVLDIADVSLDPNDQYFVEPIINENGLNISYRTGVENHLKWIKVKSLLIGEYTTSADNDVRPVNIAGKVIVVKENRIYSVSKDESAIGKETFVYPNPYNYPRSFYKVLDQRPAIALDGLLSASGLTVTGTNTEFTTELEAGDYIYLESVDEARQVRQVIDDATLILETAFTADFSGEACLLLGFIEVGQFYDLSTIAESGDRYSLSFNALLIGGYDGDKANIKQSHYLPFTDTEQNILENAVFGANMGLIRIVTDTDDPYIQQQFISYAEAKAYEFRATIPMWVSSAAVAEVFVNRELGRSNNITVAFPSYGYYPSPINNGDRLIPLNGDIVGGESNYAQINDGYHVPFAGVNAALRRFRKLPYTIDIKTQQILNNTGIQPIKFINGQAVVFGARCPSRNAVFNRIHVGRFQHNLVRIFLEASTLLEMLFLPKNPTIVEHLIMLFNKFFANEYAKGAINTEISFTSAVSIESANLNAGVGLVNLRQGVVSIAITYTVPDIIEVIELNITPRNVALNASNESFRFES